VNDHQRRLVAVVIVVAMLLAGIATLLGVITDG